MKKESCVRNLSIVKIRDLSPSKVRDNSPKNVKSSVSDSSRTKENLDQFEAESNSQNSTVTDEHNLSIYESVKLLSESFVLILIPVSVTLLLAMINARVYCFKFGCEEQGEGSMMGLSREEQYARGNAAMALTNMAFLLAYFVVASFVFLGCFYFRCKYFMIGFFLLALLMLLVYMTSFYIYLVCMSLNVAFDIFTLIFIVWNILATGKSC